MVSYGVCLSLPDLLHLVCWFLGHSMLLQMALFHSFSWPSSIPLHIHTTSLSVCERLGCFHILATVNSAAVNTLEKVSRVRHLSLFERAPAAYVSGANFLS